jgi:glycolate oxidase FAD binding subunit
MNMPHGLEAQCGGPRDWVLGLTVVLADCTIAKCGSKAVKNVAGYDVQKLLIGSRGTLAVIAEATFRTFPLRALPEPDAEAMRALDGEPIWIQRTTRREFDTAAAEAEDRLLAVDRASSTLWVCLPQGRELARFEGDWVIRSGCGAKNVSITDRVQRELLARAKGIFDPERKLNPGEFGFL